MVTLSEIEEASGIKKIRLMQQCGQERGFNHSYPGLAVMRYIERLEAERETSKRDTWGKVIKMIQDEPIFPGHMPDEVEVRMQQIGLEQFCRILGKTMKDCLIKRCQHEREEARWFNQGIVIVKKG